MAAGTALIREQGYFTGKDAPAGTEAAFDRQRPVQYNQYRSDAEFIENFRQRGFLYGPMAAFSNQDLLRF